jgi:uncharacterized repeat protein (TIGR01451 family)
MSIRFWRRVPGGPSTARWLAAYLAIVLLAAVIGPAFVGYAGEAKGKGKDKDKPQQTAEQQERDDEEAPAPAEQPAPPAPAEQPAPVAPAPLEQPTPAVTAAVVPAPVAPLEIGSTGEGNPGLTAGGMRIDSPHSGTYYLGSGGVEYKSPVASDVWVKVTAADTPSGQVFSFVSNYPVLRVIVKGGNAWNEYVYDPPVYSAAGLHAPVNASGKYAGLSHIDFYFGENPPEPETGDLAVYKFQDDDEDQTFDAADGEIMLSGWEFKVYDAETDEVVASGSTDAAGAVVFADLALGDYYVIETLQGGWDNTTDLVQFVTITACGQHALWFGNVPEADEPETGGLLVHKYQDNSDDGAFDEGEPMLANWEFTVYQSSPPPLPIEPAAIAVIGSGRTNALGELAFDDLAPGQYTVTETLTEGWRSTTGLTATVTVAAGQVAEVWFGNIPVNDEPETGDLVIHKYRDDNKNQKYEPELGEVMLSDWEFSAYRSTLPLEEQVLPLALQFVGSGTTNSSGVLTFTGLAPGEVSVTETPQDGWTNTTDLTQTAQIVAGQTTHLWFGNVEEYLPYTWLDLAILKVADDHVVDEGQLVTYTLTYWNNGDRAATDYTIVDDFDERYMTVVNANGSVVSGGTITWSMAGPLSKEMGKQTLSYTMRVKSDLPGNKLNIDNVVVIDHPDDEDPKNNRDDERIVWDPQDEPFLPFTGGEYLLLLVVAFAAGAAGLVLRARPQQAS